MDDVMDQLRRAWVRSDALFELLQPDDRLARGIPLRHPFVFYAGHLPAFAWNHLSRVTGAGPFEEELDLLFERGIDPEDEGDAAASAPEAWPAWERILAYRDGIRRRLPELAAALPSHDEPLARWVLPMVLEHELMHHETLLYMIHRLPPERLRGEGWPVATPGDGDPGGEVEVGGGAVRLGTGREALGFGWDNEFPARRVEVEGFRIDRTPVTVGQWRTFVEAGGYRSSASWTEEDRAWRDGRQLAHPDNWRRTDQGWEVRSLFGWYALDEVAGWPVQVSFAEARAWCAWTGDRRLPSEAELHRAAFTTPDGAERVHPWGDAAPGPEHGGLDFQTSGPLPVGAHPAARSAWGVDELVGNGWEWTATPFLAQPGFEAHLRTYPGYSADFFDGKHFVVFGGSWATDRRLLRRSFRNWYQRHYPYVFASFRTVAR